MENKPSRKTSAEDLTTLEKHVLGYYRMLSVEEKDKFIKKVRDEVDKMESEEKYNY